MSGTVGVVVVSHSSALADAAVALAAEMVPDGAVRVQVAAGLDATTFGTDATAISAAVESVDDGSGAGVVVLMDLGSAVLSAQLALELLAPEQAERVTLCSAPLVEGLVVALVAAAGGATRPEVAAEAAAALDAKRAQVGDASPPAPGGPDRPAPAAQTGVFVVRNPHGLHARPAARLVQEARRFDAEVILRNLTTGAGPVPATSLSKVATLAALAGHEVRVEASGPDAADAVRQITALAAQGFGEATATPTPAPAARGESLERAVAASPGIAVGTAWVPGAEPIHIPSHRNGDPATQRRRLDAAIRVVREDLGRLRGRTAAAEAGIFDAHLALLEDPDLLGRVESAIAAGSSDAAAWHRAVEEVAAEWDALPDPYLRARAADVRAVGDAALRALLGLPSVALPVRAPDADTTQPPTAVVVAADLTPADAARLDPAAVAGIVLAGSGPTAHAVLLARARGIPAVVGAGPAVLEIAAGTPVALDGGTGRVEVDPPPEVLTAYAERAAAERAAAAEARSESARPARTRDGVQVHVGANVASVGDAAAAAAGGADLAGLVRTELLFADRDTAPDVDAQAATYLAVAEALGGRRIVIRTLDVGGDKPLPWVSVDREENPFLGVRGLRLSLARPELLETQLAAVVRAARETPVGVMFPMVSGLAELRAARGALAAAVARSGRRAPAGLEVGVMVEVPAAALKAATLAPYVDFLSVGTNDLAQYAMAAERGNPALAVLGDALDPGVLRLVAEVCRAARNATNPPVVAVCGELAGDPVAVPVLLGLGVRELSVAPAVVAGVKQSVRATDVRQAAAVAKRLLGLPDAAAVRAALRERTGSAAAAP